MITQEQISNIAHQQGIDEFSILREYIQVIFLTVLYSNNESQEVYFKGGTAIRLLFFPARYSEDLDFTTLLSVKDLKKLLLKTEKQLQKIIPEIYIKDIEIKNYSLQATLTFKRKIDKFNLNIHLDFSLREKPLKIESTILETNYPVHVVPIVLHLDWEEILAEKIRALFGRNKGRDIFDIWLLISKGVNLNMEIINEKLKIYNITVKFEDICNKIKDFPEEVLKQDLGKFLSQKDRPIVDQLKQNTVKQIKEWSVFNIKESLNINFSKECFDQNILNINLKENNLEILLANNKQVYISPNNKKGENEIEYIYKEKDKFINKQYALLVENNFSRN